MSADKITELKQHAIKLLEAKKPDESASLADIQKYMEALNKVKVDELENAAEKANQELTETVKNLIEGMKSQIESDTIRDLKEEIRILEHELAEARKE